MKETMVTIMENIMTIRNINKIMVIIANSYVESLTGSQWMDLLGVNLEV